MDNFQLYVLFDIGLGFNLAGAYLVARGVVSPPATLVRLVAFMGSYQHTAAGRARDRLDALGRTEAPLGGDRQAAKPPSAPREPASAD